MSTLKTTTVMAGVAVYAMVVSRATADDQRGFKFNNLTVSPYVNFEYAYDSNVNFNRQRNLGGGTLQGDEVGDNILTVSPGVDLNYTGNEWGLIGNAWWGYDYYNKVDDLSGDRYGESLSFYREAAKGWRFALKQGYVKSSQNDSIIEGGQGVRREQEVLNLNGELAYQASEKTKVTLGASFMDLTYDNRNAASDIFGWQEYGVSLELARKLTEKSDVLLAGSYKEFFMDNRAPDGDANSTEYGLMAGFGSRASQKIRYRVTTGASLYEFDNGDQEVAWTYSLNTTWVINKKVSLSAAGSRFFQPSKTGNGAFAEEVTALSGGVTYRPAKKVTTRFDVAWRREDEQSSDGLATTGTDDLLSVRLKADYELSRFATLYGGFEYETLDSDQSASDFDRLRGTLGVTLRY